MVSFVAIPFLFQGRFGNVVFSEVTIPWHVAVHAENKEEVLGVVREVFGRDVQCKLKVYRKRGRTAKASC